MESLLDFLKGPMLGFAIIVFAAGLLRHVALALWSIVDASRRAADHSIPYRRVLGDTAFWMFPVTRLHRAMPVYSFSSFLFHGAIILSALFLQEHIDLFGRLGLSWPDIPRLYVDILAAVAFAGLFVMLGYRLYSGQTRATSGLVDYALLVLLLVTVGFGMLAGRNWNPIPYDLTMAVHISAGLTIIILTPFTKLAHCVLFPLSRLSTELGWHFTQQGGYDVVETLHGPEGRRI